MGRAKLTAFRAVLAMPSLVFLARLTAALLNHQYTRHNGLMASVLSHRAIYACCGTCTPSPPVRVPRLLPWLPDFAHGIEFAVDNSEYP